MIRPPPKTYNCPSCSWSKTVSPRSDALSPLDYFSECPKCGEENLEATPANSIAVAISNLKELLR